MLACHHRCGGRKSAGRVLTTTRTRATAVASAYRSAHARARVGPWIGEIGRRRPVTVHGACWLSVAGLGVRAQPSTWAPSTRCWPSPAGPPATGRARGDPRLPGGPLRRGITEWEMKKRQGPRRWGPGEEARAGRRARGGPGRAGTWCGRSRFGRLRQSVRATHGRPARDLVSCGLQVVGQRTARGGGTARTAPGRRDSQTAPAE